MHVERPWRHTRLFRFTLFSKEMILTIFQYMNWAWCEDINSVDEKRIEAS